MNELLTTHPTITTTILAKGRSTLGHETNLARAPIWHARPRSADDETVVAPILFGHPFRKVEGRTLTTTDQRLFAHLTTSYIRTGCPSSRQVSFSLGDAASAVGHEMLGGKQRSLVRASLARLRGVTFESALRHADGNETVLGWGLIDSYLVTSSGGGKGWVKLSEAVASLLKEGSVTFLHAPTWEAICAEDEVAGRLWSFLESENLGHGWRYSLFAPEGLVARPAPSMPSIAQVLQLSWSSRRRRVAQRVREACSVIEEHDKRYRLSVTNGKDEGSWVLICSRTRTARPLNIQSVPEVVLRAWRLAYRSHLPSARQRAVIIELLTRRSPEWVAERLGEASDSSDRFRHVLDADGALSARSLTAARRAEERWAQEKEHESASAEQSLAELIGRVRAYAEPASSP